jgi:hypothetical protein
MIRGGIESSIGVRRFVYAHILIRCKEQLNEDLNGEKAERRRNKKKIRAEGTALERNLESLMFYIHFTWAEMKMLNQMAGNRGEQSKDLLDRNVD